MTKPARLVLLIAAIAAAIFLVALSLRQSTAPRASAAGYASEVPYGMDLLLHPEKISELRPRVRAGQVSSHAKDGLNLDQAHAADDGQESYLYQNGSNYVILDERGPGAVTRIWFTYTDIHPDTTYKYERLLFFFNDEASPRVDMPLEDFFSGTRPPFVSPLVGNRFVSSGGHYSYIPLSFSQSLRIELTTVPGYYNIGFEKYDPTISVTTFKPGMDVSGVVTKWKNTGQDPKNDLGDPALVTGSIDAGAPLVSGGARELLDVAGPGIIKSIKLTIPGYNDPNDPVSREFFTNVRLRASWDGSAQPNVDSPLGAFFGSFAGKTDTQGLFFGSNAATGEFYNYFPMPFGSSAQVELFNGSGAEVSGVDYAIEYVPVAAIDGLGTKTGYFNASYSAEEPVTSGVDFNIGTIAGRGQVVGHSFLAKCWSPYPGLNTFAQCLEGDERFHIDESLSPAMYGTGTEDYFNGGGYFKKGTFSRPTHGNNFKFYKPNPDPETLDGYSEDAAWRLFLADPLPFRSKVELGIEHGNPGAFLLPDEKSTWPGNYYSVVFWYGAPSTDLVEEDTLDVGDAVSEAAHAYGSSNATDIALEEHFYEGDEDEVPVSDDGESGAGPVEFTMSVADGRAHILRRRLDQGVRNQSATVSIDGVEVGPWFDGGRNTVLRWKESEFFIPAAQTAGKSEITIEITPVDGSTWTAYRYGLYSIPSSVAGATATPTPTADVALDSDRDGCSDEAERGPDPAQGGLRNPKSFWDFADQWTGAPAARDASVTIGDVGAVALRFGSAGDASGDPLEAPASESGYHSSADRSPSLPGDDPWKLGPPDGAIVVGDIGGVVGQFGHACS